MKIEFEVSDLIPATPDAIYSAWLSSDGHSEMTGSSASVSSVIGKSFEACDGYIQGTNVELESPRRIFQQWRSVDFEDSDADSFLEVLFESAGEATRVTVRHSNLPDHGMQYQQGWIDAYFTPMKAYFGEIP